MFPSLFRLARPGRRGRTDQPDAAPEPGTTPDTPAPAVVDEDLSPAELGPDLN